MSMSGKTERYTIIEKAKKMKKDPYTCSRPCACDDNGDNCTDPSCSKIEKMCSNLKASQFIGAK